MFLNMLFYSFLSFRNFSSYPWVFIYPVFSVNIYLVFSGTFDKFQKQTLSWYLDWGCFQLIDYLRGTDIFMILGLPT